jgi:hypothetical protein
VANTLNQLAFSLRAKKMNFSFNRISGRSYDPYSNSEINRLCSPAITEGPRIALRRRSRALRTPDDVIAWAEMRLHRRMATIFNGK